MVNLLSDDFSDLNESLLKDRNIEQYAKLLQHDIKFLPGWHDIRSIVLKNLIRMMKRAWRRSCSHHRLANSLVDTFQKWSIPKWLASGCDSKSDEIKFLCGELLMYCLNDNNIEDILENYFPMVAELASTSWPQGSRMNAGLLERVFMHSEEKCELLVHRGCLDMVLSISQNNDIETSRYCAKALVNLCLYGGANNQKMMVEPQRFQQLISLCFDTRYKDNYTIYYACMAFVILVSTQEVEIEIENKMNEIERFIADLDYLKFAELNFSQGHDQSRNWLQRVVPLFNSKYQEARALAAFHFTMEVNYKGCHCGIDTETFYAIGAVDALREIARCSGESALTVNLANQALIGLGAKSPQEFANDTLSIKSSQSIENANVEKYSNKASTSRAQWTGDDLIENRTRKLSISNSLIKAENTFLGNKPIDIFISYRRSNGSHLASLLRDYLKLKYNVFIDVNELEAGRFDDNLLRSIQQAKTFVLILTQNALDRCFDDYQCEDWIHKEIVAARESGCKIIPVVDNFTWPEPKKLPDDMRCIINLNAVRWIHEYQKEGCIQKLERFIKK